MTNRRVIEYVRYGSSPFAKWFSALDAQATAKVAAALYRLGQGNVSNDLATTPEYDKNKNRTSWTVELPERTGDLAELSAESDGIFDRVVQIEVPLQGCAGWQLWRTMRWQNASQTPSVLRVSLAGLPRDASKLRITMEHGDNRPIELRKLQASYGAPALLFLASAAWDYALFGGNDAIGAAKYDLTLVQAHLANVLPKTVEMGSVE